MTEFELFKQAKKLVEQEKFSDALKIYQKLLDTNQTDAYLWYTIGHLHEILENYKEAAVCFDKALSLGYGVDIEHVLEQKM